MLGNIDSSLAEIAAAASPNEGSGDPPQKKRKVLDAELSRREERAMHQLYTFVEEKGGSKSMVSSFSARVSRKASQKNKFDTQYFDDNGRRFRSMLDVGRALGLVSEGDAGARRVMTKAGSTEQAERKRLRRELERLRKGLQRATKALDEENPVALDEGKEVMVSTSSHEVAPESAILQSSLSSFETIPHACVPELVMTWNFLCTFEKSLSLSTISFQDFVDAVTYFPPCGHDGDDVKAPPVLLAEAHLALLKLVLQDKSSDDWWWSTLESSEDSAALEDGAKDGEGKPLIKIDMAAMLSEKEDPLITTSWLRVLDLQKGSKGSDVKKAIRAALDIVGNKWVAAYLRKVLAVLKIRGMPFAIQSISWLVQQVHAARPDLSRKATKADELDRAKKAVIEEAHAFMEGLPDSVPVVAEDDLSDYEDDDSDESDAEENPKKPKPQAEDTEMSASAIPVKPLPSLVDMLLPPSRPSSQDEFINPFTWTHIVGAVVARMIHRRKRTLNEMDDNLREARHLPPILVPERRKRESLVVARVLSGGEENSDLSPKIEAAVTHLCSGSDYMLLSVEERIGLLRLLVELAYDTTIVHDVVMGNHLQRSTAMKALEVEQRRAKREAKEKSIADELAAREQLAAQAREVFLEQKRAELKRFKSKSTSLSVEVVDSLTCEEVIELDEEFKKEFDELPAPESFSKIEVQQLVSKLQETSAFGAESVSIISLEELLVQDAKDLEQLEQQLAATGLDSNKVESREELRIAEKLQKEVEKARLLPELRQNALEQLKEAMHDGTIKSLRGAIALAKKAKLTGPEEGTGVWAVEILRDAAIQLDKAKQNKRVADARRDLLTKRNKCFIRCEPLGCDRYGNRFWAFEGSHLVWIDGLYQSDCDDPSLAGEPGSKNRCNQPFRTFIEADFLDDPVTSGTGAFHSQECHSSASNPVRFRRHWSCLSNEEALRKAIKRLTGEDDGERQLKARLKDTLDSFGDTEERQEHGEDIEQADQTEYLMSGDERAFEVAKQSSSAGEVDDRIGQLSTAIGLPVRVRIVVENQNYCRYENGSVVSWGCTSEGVVLWKVETEYDKTITLNGDNLVDSLVRFLKRKDGDGYFESDSSFIAYRNSIGRFCGRAADAAHAASPFHFARQMIKCESDFYPKLKVKCYDNNWGGKSGSRALWINSMKDYAYDFETVRQGLLTLEGAIFELTGGFAESENMEQNGDVQSLLNDPKHRINIELESIEKTVSGLWNSNIARQYFIHIVSTSRTTGFLALLLDLLCRNTLKYLVRNKLMDVARETPARFERTSQRTTRRMNAWQQKQQLDDEEWDF